ncbi:MAG: hypothetical protein LC704_02230 [Actinobacteria bacterium]|nr:hypothetical protein [Actinomycetota bacterium]
MDHSAREASSVRKYPSSRPSSAACNRSAIRSLLSPIPRAPRSRRASASAWRERLFASSRGSALNSTVSPLASTHRRERI